MNKGFYTFLSILILVFCALTQAVRAEEPQDGVQLKVPKLTSQEIRDRLAKEFNVHIKTDSSDLFDQPMLEYLLSFFKTFDYQHGPINLHATQEDKPGFVWKRGNNIYFTKNAGDKIPNRVEEQVAEYIESLKSNPDACIPNSVVYEFNNELFYYLALQTLTADQIAKVLKDELGIEAATSEKEVADKSYEHYFSAKELIMIIKQFLDLPHELIKDLPITRLIRMRAGIKIPGGGVAAYNPIRQDIRISDKAFSKSDPLGEGAMLHELAHAYWRKMTTEEQDQFISISWNQNKKGEVISADPNTSEWISSYSTKDFEEDFAEHFSAFVHQSEKLKNVAPQKYEFFKGVVFKDTEYFSDAHKKAKIYVESENPDTEPPYLTTDIHKAIKLELKQGENDETVEIASEICGVHDDLSGVEKILLGLFEKNSEKRYPDFYIPFNNDDCSDIKNGIYAASNEIDCREFKAGIYEVRKVKITDRTGNERICSLKGTDSPPSIYIPGLKQDLKSRLPHIMSTREGFKQIKITNTNDKHGSQILNIEFPFEHDSTLSIVQLVWLNEEDQTSFFHTLGTGLDADRFESNPGDAMLKLKDIIIPVEYPNGVIRLESVNLTYSASSEHQGGRFQFATPKDLPNLVFHHSSNRKKLGEIGVDLNRLELIKLNQGNDEGGNIDIVTSLPVDGDAIYSLYMNVLLTPSGRVISGTEMTDLEGFVTGGKIKRIKFSLPPNHEEGEYILSQISIYEEPQVISRGEYPSSINFRKLNIKLLERGIRKTIKVESEPEVDVPKKK